MNEADTVLGDITILDLADEKGSFCSRLLADLGASVIKIEFPEGSHEREIGPSLVSTHGKRISLPFAYHNSNKLGLVLDPRTADGRRTFHRLVKKADVLIETFRSSRIAGLDLRAQSLSRINPGLIHLSITAFGRTGPKRKFHFSDSVGCASGGQMYLSGSPQGPPVKPCGLQSCYAACLYGAIAVLLGLRRRKITGTGNYFDLSIQEAVASTLDHAFIDYFRQRRIAQRQGEHYENGSFSIVRCKDGFFQISILGNWETLLELLACEGKAEDLTDPQWQQRDYREVNYEHIFKVVEKWACGKTKMELFELGQAMRFPWAPVMALEEVLDSPQLEARRFFLQTLVPEAGLKIIAPGTPYKLSTFLNAPPKPAPLLGQHTEQVLSSLTECQESKPVRRVKSRGLQPYGEILKGIRVVDLTRMLSGPLATRILADFGAEVIKVQSAVTSHGAERNDTVQFAALNRNKRSISLNLDHKSARDVFVRLVALSDVVVENYSPRVMANWGLTYEQLKKANPGIIMASISAFGSDGPWKDYVGFSPTFHALSGILSLMPRFDDRPVNLGHAYGDVVAGLYAAVTILSALQRRERTGKGLHIDLSAYEALCTLLGPEHMKISFKRKPPVNDWHRQTDGEAAPSGCYPCKGRDRWCVIAICSDEQWEKFCRISRQAEWSAPQYASRAERIKHRAELEELVARWTVSQKAESLAGRLQRAGIPAAVVQNAEDLAKDRHLAVRRFFTTIRHPVLGVIRLDRSALWPWDQSTEGWKAAPLLGQDNHYVFAELLGMSEDEIRSLTDQGALR